ncbi:MAG: FkbM family methyltransferase [Planctomycetota bacterium]|jgi:hypothetical protein
MHSIQEPDVLAPTRSPTWLLEHARNVNSQNGEDGILEKILEVIGSCDDGSCDQWCVEFGAWDGRYYSNTYNLIEHHGYSAVPIEADAKRFEELVQCFAGNRGVHPLHALVGCDHETGLDALLKRTPIPKDFDVLSIDIDGNDYHVWDAVREYRPKVVVIEYNPTIPTEVDFVQADDPSVQHGSSLAALDRLAREKGYELLAVTKVNAIFDIRDNRVWVMRGEPWAVTYLFNGYDGTVFVRGRCAMGWHHVRYRESRMQQIPRWMRQYPDHYGPVKRILARWYCSLKKRRLLP